MRTFRFTAQIFLIVSLTACSLFENGGKSEIEGTWTGVLKLDPGGCLDSSQPTREERHLVTVTLDRVLVECDFCPECKGTLANPSGPVEDEFTVSADRDPECLRCETRTITYQNITAGTADVTLRYSPYDGPGGYVCTWRGQMQKAEI